MLFVYYGFAIGGISLMYGCTESTIERTARLWDSEVASDRVPRLGVAPVAGGATLSLSGSF